MGRESNWKITKKKKNGWLSISWQLRKLILVSMEDFNLFYFICCLVPNILAFHILDAKLHFSHIWIIISCENKKKVDEKYFQERKCWIISVLTDWIFYRSMVKIIFPFKNVKKIGWSCKYFLILLFLERLKTDRFRFIFLCKIPKNSTFF